MSHIVIHDDIDGVTQYRQFDDLGNAVSHLEELRNSEAADDAKLYELDEVEFEVKTYFKVEVVTDHQPPAETQPVHVAAEPVSEPEILPTVEDVTYVEAAMQPIETVATEADPDDEDSEQEWSRANDESIGASGADVRRGLFGR